MTKWRVQMLILLSTIIGCGPKEAPETATPPPAPEPEVVEKVEPEPEPEPEPAKPSPNADFNIKLSYSDGTTKEGHVIRLERSSDFYGMKDWYDKESKLTIYSEAGTTAKDLTWTDVKTINIAATKDIGCIYESDWNPWLYICTMKTDSSLVDSSGGKWNVDSKYRWRITFDDNTETEFWLQNIRSMEQDDKEVELGMDNNQNHDLYGKLQEQLTSSAFVTKIEIQ
jgi:hypothetical protein